MKKYNQCLSVVLAMLSVEARCGQRNDIMLFEMYSDNSIYWHFAWHACHYKCCCTLTCRLKYYYWHLHSHFAWRMCWHIESFSDLRLSVLTNVFGHLLAICVFADPSTDTSSVLHWHVPDRRICIRVLSAAYVLPCLSGIWSDTLLWVATLCLWLTSHDQNSPTVGMFTYPFITGWLVHIDPQSHSWYYCWLLIPIIYQYQWL